MKVKIIEEKYYPIDNRAVVEEKLEVLINDFIKDKKVVDIKYQSNRSGFAVNGIRNTDYERTALIMYEETADKPVVEKLKEEKADLDEKIRKLKTFLNDDEKLSSIGIQQPSLMRTQLKIMEQYSSILELRLYFLER